jgi:hypothetical protein
MVLISFDAGRISASHGRSFNTQKPGVLGWPLRIWRSIRELWRTESRYNSTAPESWDWRQDSIRKVKISQERRRLKELQSAGSIVASRNRASRQGPAPALADADDGRDEALGMEMMERIEQANDLLDARHRYSAAFDATDGLSAGDICVRLDPHTDLDEINIHLPIVAIEIQEAFVPEALQQASCIPPL